MTDEPPAEFDGTAGEPIRVGILVDGPDLAAWQLECLRKVQELPFARLVVVVTNIEPAPLRRSLLSRLRNSLASGLLLWRIYERAVLTRKSRAMRRVPLPEEVAQLPRVEILPVKLGKFRQTFDESSLKALRNFQVDVLLRFGFGILSGEALSLPKYGVWSFHHGDPEHFRGAPPGFWEIEARAPVTGVVLQRLTEKLDGGVILHSGWFRTNAASYAKSLDRILFDASHFVARALVDLKRNPKELLERSSLANCGKVYRYPRTAAMFRFLANSTFARIRDQYRSLFRHQQWTVGVIERPLSEIFQSISGSAARISAVNWRTETKGRFLADPFPVPNTDAKNDLAILVEDFDWTTDLGQIAVIEWPWAKTQRSTPLIQSSGHLSYPYTFEHEGQSYCVPENAHLAHVMLHRLIDDKRGTVAGKIILENFRALDPTIFQHEGRWWLFCTNAETGPNEFLYAWYADRLDSKWMPHPANPLKVDVRSARPAGRPFLGSGELIRPAQDCSNGYGGAISFNRITKLTPHEFREEPAGKLLPENGKYRAGLHTINVADGLTIVDGARTTFIPAEFRRALQRKFRRSS